MQDIERELRLKQLRLILIIMLVIFVAMLSYTIYWCADYKEKYGFFVETQAVVDSHVEIAGDMYDVLKYDVNNVTFKKTTTYFSKNDVGDEITIYYDKNNPSGVIYSLDINRIILPVISLVFGVVVTALIVIYYLLVIGDKKKKVKHNKKKLQKNKTHK